MLSYEEVDIVSLRRDLAVVRMSLMQKTDEAEKATAKANTLETAITQMHEAAPQLWSALQRAAMTECANGHLQSALSDMRHETVSVQERTARQHEEHAANLTAQWEKEQNRADTAEAQRAMLAVEARALRSALDAAVQRVPQVHGVVELTEATVTLEGLRAILTDKDAEIAQLRGELSTARREATSTAEAVRATAALYSNQQRLVAEYERLVKGMAECVAKVEGEALHAQLWSTWTKQSTLKMTRVTLCGALLCRGVRMTPEQISGIIGDSSHGGRPMDDLSWQDFAAVMRWADSVAVPPTAAVKDAVEKISSLWKDMQSHHSALNTSRTCTPLQERIALLEKELKTTQEALGEAKRERSMALRRRGMPGHAAMVVALMEALLVKPVKDLPLSSCLELVYSVLGVTDAVDFYEMTSGLIDSEFDGNASVLYPVLMNSSVFEARRVLTVARPRSEIGLCDFAIRYVLCNVPNTPREILGAVKFVWLPQRVLLSLQGAVGVWAKCPRECLCGGVNTTHQHVCLPLQDFVAHALERKRWVRSLAAENASRGEYEMDFMVRASYSFATCGVVATAERMARNEVAPTDLKEIRYMQDKVDAL